MEIDISQLSPMMQHYMETKKEYPDCILFYRLGDFYEMFFDDALAASKALEITLTGKECGLKERAPMCGVPYHAVDSYLYRLVQKGFKVAIAEQMEDPKQAKGLVKREVIRVVTPGTITSAQALDETKNNYLMGIVYVDGRYGISTADISTGEFLVTEVDSDRELFDEINKFSPSEIICNNAFYMSGVDLDELKNRLKSGNKAFDALLAEYVNYATDYYAVIFLYTPRTKHPEKSMRPDYYRHIVSEDKFTDDGVLQFPDGVRMLSSYVSFAQEENDLKYGDAQYTENSLSYLPDNRLKGEYLISSVFRNFKSYGQYLSAMEQYGKYLVTPSLKERAEAVGTKLYDTKPGGRAADFTYPDTGGKMVSLSDFKGKVVLVDVWATWCGPCRQQIPYLKKLEEELHGEDIVFLGVSVDESKDKQKWLDFIEKEDLKGVQLLAGGWSKITKDYKINGIPRFMVFDKQGNIVSVDAPRPSSPELKRMLETELKK